MAMGGVVLCGGQSRRMGQSKAMLPFGPECMLQRVVRLLGEAVGPIVVVAAPDQPLPPLPAEVELARDRRPHRGPLEGIAVGLQALAGRVQAAYVSACDVPLLVPAFVRRVAEMAANWPVAVPHVGGYDEPLAAVYRVEVLPQIEALLAAGRWRPVLLFDVVPTLRIPEEVLREVDPELLSLRNINQPEQYAQTLRRAGLSP